MSRPLSNLTDPIDYRQFVADVKTADDMLGIPDIVAHDCHPMYMTTHLAQSLGRRTVSVQHHHAHIAAVMAEYGAESNVVGVCCDGVGWGTDGAAWGGELLFCHCGRFERLGHLEYFPLFGHDAAAIETWRPAAALLKQAYGSDWRNRLTPPCEHVPSAHLDLFESATASNVSATATSSLGRVFDGVSFLLGLCDRNGTEAQAASALERAADVGDFESYPYETTVVAGSIRMSLAPSIRALVRDVAAAKSVGVIAARFHETIARMLTASALLGCDLRNVDTVALGGGCFANRRLLSLVDRYLSLHGVRTLKNKTVSCGDAGLSLGQAFVASQLERVA
jgi:hydrogenase maturation protein HypF